MTPLAGFKFSHCKIEIVLPCSDSYTLELSLLALKAVSRKLLSVVKLPLNTCLMGFFIHNINHHLLAISALSFLHSGQARSVLTHLHHT